MRLAHLLLASLAALAPTVPAEDRDSPPPATEEIGTGSPANRITVEQQRAIDRGLQWLAAQQDPRGGFPTTSGSGASPRSADFQTAVTSLSLLAFLGAGHGISHGPHHETVGRAVRWLLDAQREDGYISFGNDKQSRMHGHGFATLALAEAYASAASTAVPDGGDRTPEALRLRDLSRRLRAAVQNAVDLIERSQATIGGWDYLPSTGGRNDHEGSITVCMVQALLSASNRGFRVSQSRIDKAREYMKKSQAPSGGFKYRLSNEDGEETRYSYALTAAGVTSILGLADWNRKEAIERGMKFLERRGAVPHRDRTPYFFYGSFYAVQAFHWCGGQRWERFWIPMRANLLADQNEDGSWSGQDHNLDLGRAYPTAFTLLMLEVPVEYLSIFAR